MPTSVSKGILSDEDESGRGSNMAFEVYKNESDLLDRHIGCDIFDFLNINEDQ